MRSFFQLRQGDKITFGKPVALFDKPKGNSSKIAKKELQLKKSQDHSISQ